MGCTIQKPVTQQSLGTIDNPIKMDAQQTKQPGIQLVQEKQIQTTQNLLFFQKQSQPPADIPQTQPKQTQMEPFSIIFDQTINSHVFVPILAQDLGSSSILQQRGQSQFMESQIKDEENIDQIQNMIPSDHKEYFHQKN